MALFGTKADLTVGMKAAGQESVWEHEVIRPGLIFNLGGVSSEMIRKVAIVLVCWLAGNMAVGESFDYEEGTHYAELVIPLKTGNKDKIEVTEYFSYGCPHCYQFDPMITAWEENLEGDVSFSRTPAIWNKDYQVYAQTYYAAKALDISEKLHTPLFQAIHAQRKRLNDPKLMAVFFSDFGIDPVDFAKVYNSFGVRASVQQAEARGRAYRSGGVPAIIVNGKYRIESQMAGSNSNMLRITDYLVQKERDMMKSQESASD
ncbi:MAG: disulfide bond formation protein DsbA [Gammaproteobacteria bacterium]|nr:disulfide bond formation protein DsbA [Gammaproteobacteria bacterium]